MVKMMYLGISLLCLIIVPGSFSNDDMHKYMSPEEVQQVFHTDHDSVPKYEIVKVNLSERLHKRALPAGHKMSIKAFGEDINLWLHPGDTVLAGEDTPVYYAKYSSSIPQGVEYTKQDGLMKKVGRIFEDPEKLATFVIGTEDSGSPRINGHIGSKKMAVRSLPRRVAEEYRRRRRSVGDFDDSDSQYHVVFETVNPYMEDEPKLPINMTLLRQRIPRSTSKVPDILYPEILVVVEYSMYRTFKNDVNGLLEYLLAFWNGVDLKYRSLESPKIRFNIAGIILAEDFLATPYISDNSLIYNVFNSSAAIVNVGQFYFAVQDQLPPDSYDIVVTLTMQDFGWGDDRGVLGKSYVGGGCSHYDVKDMIESVVIVQDNGAFKGIYLTAHELGHQIGSKHDDFEGSCVTEDGFIMGWTPAHSKNASDFSFCTLVQFDAYLEAKMLDCFFNEPKNTGKSLPKLMPGRIKNLEQQCQAMGYKTSCEAETDYDICTNMHCRKYDGECKKSGASAVDGTSCEGDNKFCLHMKCVSL